MNVQQLENERWEAADQLRANSKLTAAEYAMPVLGLIFLRHADNRFKAYRLREGFSTTSDWDWCKSLIRTYWTSDFSIGFSIAPVCGLRFVQQQLAQR